MTGNSCLSSAFSCTLWVCEWVPICMCIPCMCETHNRSKHHWQNIQLTSDTIFPKRVSSHFQLWVTKWHLRQLKKALNDVRLCVNAPVTFLRQRLHKWNVHIPLGLTPPGSLRAVQFNTGCADWSHVSYFCSGTTESSAAGVFLGSCRISYAYSAFLLAIHDAENFATKFLVHFW